MRHDVQTGEDFHPPARESRWRYVMPVINAGMTYLPAIVAGGVTLNSFRDEKPSSNRLPLDKQVDNVIIF